MTFTKTGKTEIIHEYQTHEGDTGSSEVQIALLTGRLKYLTDHFKTHAKDHHSRHGLIKIVNRRRKLLDYLKKEDFKKYQTIIKELGIRR
jgi:small subunit ribosomal protein S15